MGNWGFLLKRFRAKHGLTQERLAGMFGVSQRTVSRWERSENNPSPECQRRLRDLGWAGSETLPIGLSPSSGAQPGSGNGREEALTSIALADRAMALLSYLSAADIERLPDAQRRRLAEHCRRVAQLAGGDGAASSLEPGPADAPRRKGAGTMPDKRK